jgi:hypothetical protein
MASARTTAQNAENGLYLAQEMEDLALDADLGDLVAVVVEGLQPTPGPYPVPLLGPVSPLADHGGHERMSDRKHEDRRCD